MKRLGLLVLSITVVALLMSCGEESPTSNSGSSDYQFQYPEESALLALVESREFRPPRDLQMQIDRELTMIREQWGDSIPEVLLEYEDPWEGFCGISILVDTTLLIGADTIARKTFDSVLAAFDAEFVCFFDWWPQHCNIIPNEPWFPPAAVDSFAGLPGVIELISPPRSSEDGFNSMVRQATDSGTFWYIGSECHWKPRFHVFEVNRFRVKLVDEYHLCLLSIDSAGAVWDALGLTSIERWERQRAYEDSLAVNAPAWFGPVWGEVVGFMRGTYYHTWPEGK